MPSHDSRSARPHAITSRHEEVICAPHITELKLEVLWRLNSNFLRFFGSDWANPGKMKIRTEKITWGGFAVDGIPSLNHPNLTAAAGADYLLDDDLVFGVEINGDARAYPLE